MKINLEATSDTYINGYINVSMMPTDARIAPCDPKNLNSICENGEAEEIIANYTLQKIDHELLPNTIEHWNKKLKMFGNLYVSFFDIRQICREGYTGGFSLEQLHNSILGYNNENRIVIDLYTAKALFLDLGFRAKSITSKDTLVLMHMVKVGEINDG